ncbi:MAG: hypothetical protein GQ570_08295 [Helicobacteraceae bacterium]|nr:hypothetical protein [Helicobacteraceae bacterium]
MKLNKQVNLLTISLKDFTNPKIIRIAILPFIVTSIVMYLLFFTVANKTIEALGNSTIQTTSSSSYVDQNGYTHTEKVDETYSGSSIIDFLMKHAITSYLISFFVYTVGSFLILLLSIFISIIVIGFLTPHILGIIQKEHYPQIEFKGFGNIFISLLYLLKTFIVMILLFLLLTPLYFIPLINMVVINLPFWYFFHKLLIFDVGSTLNTKEEYDQIVYFNSSSLKLKTLSLYLLSLVPFVILFTSVFYIVYIGHSFFNESKKLR